MIPLIIPIIFCILITVKIIVVIQDQILLVKLIKQFEILLNLGIFQDTAFQSFLISFYEASRLLGPEMAVRNNGQKPRGKVITMDDFNQLVNAAMLAAMFSAPWSQKEVEHVKTILESNPEVIGSFLYEFADGLITMDRAKNFGE